MTNIDGKQAKSFHFFSQDIFGKNVNLKSLHTLSRVCIPSSGRSFTLQLPVPSFEASLIRAKTVTKIVKDSSVGEKCPYKGQPCTSVVCA